jgi:hypothetical protein
MTPTEYQNALDQLSDEAFSRFCDAFGGPTSRKDQVREFVDHPEHERRICYLLRLETEAEKGVRATLASAAASQASAESSRTSARSAIVSGLVAAVALVLSLTKACT